MRVGLSHLREQWFKHTFKDALDPICNCAKNIGASSYYLIHCLDYLQQRMNLFYTLSSFDSNILDSNNAHLNEIILYGKVNW